MNPLSIKINNDEIDNVKINLEIELNHSELLLKLLDKNNKIFKTIKHEILHIIEIYLSKTNPKNLTKELSNSWKMGDDLEFLKNKYQNCNNWINDISYFIYLSLPHEMRAKIEELNGIITLNNIKGVENAINFIKTTKAYKDVEFLSNIDGNILLKKLKKDIEYNALIKDFSLIFLKNNKPNYENNFLNYIQKIKIKNKNLLRKFIKTSYAFEHMGMFEEFDKIINYKDYL